MKIKGQFLLCVMFGILAHAVCWAGNWPQPQQLTWETIISRMDGLAPDDMKNADTVLLDDDISIRYEADGTWEQWNDRATLVVTDKGVQSMQVVASWYDARTSVATVPLVQVRKADGRVLDVDLSNQVQEVINGAYMSANIYDPNDKVIQVAIPNLERGDIVRTVMYDALLRPRVPDTFYNYHPLESDCPIVHSKIQIDGPKALPLCHTVVMDKQGDRIKTDIQEQGERVVRIWELNDMPQAFPEPAMPEMYSCVQRLLVSTIKSWEDVSRWYWKISEPHLKASPEMEQKVAELCAGLDGDMEKIKAVYHFVSQQIRYMGITLETEAPGYEPHDVSLTFARRHGVCRDKAALLVAMLRCAGFDAYPVLIMVGPKKDPEVPQPGFNHAISCVKRSDGSYLLMDSTNESSRDLFPAYLGDSSYLVAHPEGESLQTSPVPPYQDNLLNIKTNCKMDVAGGLRGESFLDFQGMNDNAYRGALLHRTPEQRREVLARLLDRAMPGTRLIDCRIVPENLQDPGQNLQMTLTYEVPDVLADNEKTGLLSMPYLSSVIGYVNVALGNMGLTERRFNFETKLPCGIHEEIALEMPLEWSKPIAIPQPVELESTTMLWKRECRKEGISLLSTVDYAIKVESFSPEEYQEARQFLHEVEKAGRRRPMLQRYDEQPDAVAALSEEQQETDAIIENQELSYVLEEAGSWLCENTVRVKIQTYKGMKDLAELRLQYNPSWTEVELVYGKVVNGNDVKEVRPEEINVMDCDWAGSAPRYPSDKIYVVAFPDVRIGSVIEYKIRTTHHNRNFFSKLVSFQDVYPIVHNKMVLSVPLELDMDIAFYPNGVLKGTGKKSEGKLSPVVMEKTKEDGRNIWFWTCDYQPALKQENLQAPDYAVLPSVLMQVEDGWKHYRRDLYDAMQEHIKADGRITALAESLRGSVEPMKTLYSHIERMVRTSQPSLGRLPLTALTDAGKVYSDGYGNSADMAILYAAILAECGVKPEIILVSSGMKYEPLQKFWKAHPSDTIFDHVILRVKDWETGQIVWLNDPSQYGEPGTTHFDGCLAYNLTKGGFFCINADRQYKDCIAEQSLIELKTDASAEISVKKLVSGTDFENLNAEYSSMREEQRRRHYETLISAFSLKAEALTPLETAFDEYPGRVQFSVKVPSFSIMEGNFCYFNLLQNISGFIAVAGDRRTNPLMWTSTARLEYDVRIRKPFGYPEVEFAPENFDWKSPQKNCRITVKQEDSGSEQELRYVIKVEMSPELFDAENYDELLEIHRKLASEEATLVVLRRNQM